MWPNDHVFSITLYNLQVHTDTCMEIVNFVTFIAWYKNLFLNGSGGIRTHAIEMTGALNQRLRPLGHTTIYLLQDI